MDLPTNPSALIDLLRAWFFAKDRSIVMANDTFIEGDEISTPGNPVSGRRRLYAKGDCWYDLDSSGNEVSLCDTNDVEHVIIVDEKTSATHGGTCTNGAWRTRDLNTIKLNTISGCSLAANQITLPAGNFIVRGSAPGYQLGRHQTRIYNITDAAVIFSGTSEISYAGNLVQTRSIVLGYFSLAAAKVIELQHRGQNTIATTGFGFASGGSFAVTKEVYSEIIIWKI